MHENTVPRCLRPHPTLVLSACRLNSLHSKERPIRVKGIKNTEKKRLFPFLHFCSAGQAIGWKYKKGRKLSTLWLEIKEKNEGVSLFPATGPLRRKKKDKIALVLGIINLWSSQYSGGYSVMKRRTLRVLGTHFLLSNHASFLSCQSKEPKEFT